MTIGKVSGGAWGLRPPNAGSWMMLFFSTEQASYSYCIP